MPKKSADFIVARGFDYIPKGKKVERRVDAGTELPADITVAQRTRLIVRGVVTERQPVRAAKKEQGNG